MADASTDAPQTPSADQPPGQDNTSPEKIDPSVVDSIGEQILNLGGYETSRQKLSDLYTKIDWSDKELAAQKIADLGSRLNKEYERSSDIQLDKGSSLTLSYHLLDATTDDTTKLGKIEEWRKVNKEQLYNSTDPNTVIDAKQAENTIDQYAEDYRRGVIAGKRGRITDMMARGAEAAITPILGTADAVLGTGTEEAARKEFGNYENPKYDDSFVSKIASGVGSVGGFALSGANPITGYGYLGAVVVDQLKGVYDSTLKETGSHDRATEAMNLSAPAVLAGAFADKLLGGTVGAALEGSAGFKGVLHSTLVGAAGNVAQTIGVGLATAEATGNEAHIPTWKRISEDAVIGGAIGGVVGGIGKAGETFAQSRADVEEANAVKAANQQIKEARGVKAEDPVTGEPTQLEDFIGEPPKDKTTPEKPTTGDLAEADQAAPITNTPKETPDVGSFIDDVKNINTKEEGQTEPKNLKEANAAGATFIVQDPGDYWAPMPVVHEFVRQFVDGINFKGILGSWAHYDSGKNTLSFQRSLFKDVDQAHRTMAHEVGHAVNYLRLRRELAKNGVSLTPRERALFDRREAVGNKLLGIDQVLRENAVNNKAIQAEATSVSAWWRPGFGEGTPRDIAYRNYSSEVHADVFSAIMNRPSEVQAQFPLTWDTFMRGLDAHPEVKTFWDDLTRLNSDPKKLYEWLQETRQRGREKEAEIYKGGVEKEILAKQEANTFQRKLAVPHLIQRVVNAFNPGHKAAEQALGLGTPREEVFKALNDLSAGKTGYIKLKALIDAPMGKLIKDVEASGLPSVGTSADPLSLLKNYLRDIHITQDTTEVMDNIRKDPELYRAGFAEIQKLVPEEVQGRIAMSTDTADPEKLIKHFASVQALYDIVKGGKGAVDGFKSQLAQKFLGDPTNGKVYKAALDILDEDAFRARGYIANPNGEDILTSRKNLNIIKEQLGGEGSPQNKQLEGYAKRFHDITGSTAIEAIRESGIVTPDLLKRLELNRNSYVTTNVLKWFEQDPNLSATVKKQIGTLSESGDEMASTIMKEKMLYLRAQYQIAQNAAIELAKLAKKPIEVIKSLRGEKSWYDLKDKLEKEHPNNSYLIGMEDGKATLYEFRDDPLYAKMFAQASLDKTPILGTVMRGLENYNRFFSERELKIFFSPIYSVREFGRDISNEAFQARSYLPTGIFVHTDAKVATARSQGKELVHAQESGLLTPEGKFLVERGVLHPHLEASFGEDHLTPAEELVYQRMGTPIPHEEGVGLTLSANKVNRATNKLLERTFLGKVKRFVEREEAITKATGYFIGRDIRGLGPEEAAKFARENFGTPDSLGGGIEARNINKLFLFGRAHLNGMRVTANQFKADPLGFSVQYAFRKGIPRMMLSGAIMAPLIGAFFGEEEGKIARTYLDKIDSFAKMSGNIMPMGFVDQDGKWRGFNVTSKEINPNWKAVGLRLPMSRELTTLDNAFYPLLHSVETLLDTGTLNAKQMANDTAAAFGSIVGGNIAPGLSAALHVGQLASYYNPTDLYRKRGVLTQDVAEAGTLIQRTYDYLAWSLFQTAPGLFSFNRNKQASTDYTDPMDLLGQVPLAGPTIKGLLTVTNYGDYEKGKEQEARKAQIDANIRMNLGETTSTLYNEFTKNEALTQRLGKGWAQQMTPQEANNIHALNVWHTHVYRWGFNEIKDAYMKGDTETIDKQKEAMEKASEAYLKMTGH